MSPEREDRFSGGRYAAANLQGVLAATLDVDVWIGLPARSYMRVMNLCLGMGATLRGSNKVFLRDETAVDFLYEISGLSAFKKEFSGALHLPFHGLKVPVLPLERICRSKKVAGREKDALHILLIREVLRLKRVAAKSRSIAAPKRSAKARAQR